MKNMFGRYNMNNYLKIVVWITIIFFLSFLIEYFWFGERIFFSQNVEREKIVVNNVDIKSDNFSLDEDNNFVARNEKASLVLSTRGKYIKNLEIELSDNLNFPLTVSFVDPITKQEKVSEKDLQNKIKKLGLNFLDYQVFRIQNNPSEIIIRSENDKTKISKIIIDNTYYFNFYRFIFVGGILLLVSIFIIFYSPISRKPEYGFLAVALLCGTLISFTSPEKYISWDELIHYKNADRNSFKTIVKSDVKNVYSSTNSVPFSYSLKEQKEITSYFDHVPSKASQAKKKDSSIFRTVQKMYNQIGYIPSGMALMFGRLLHLPNHIIFIFGRWINVLVYAGIVFFAIRKLKSGKMIMSVIALLPTAIFLASSYNYDSWLTAFTLLGTAYIFSELQQPEKKMTRKEMGIMIGSLAVGLGPKAIYFPLLFLLFLFPKSKFISIKEYKKFIAIVIITLIFVVGSFLVPFVVSGPGDGDHRGGSEVNSTAQVHFILSEPFVYSKILLNFIKEYINPLNASGFMTSFAYLGNISGFFVLLFLLFFVTFTDKNKYDELTTTLPVRLSVIVVYLCTVSLICTALYIAFTTVRNTNIAGVQPRYLIPLLFPLLFIIGGSYAKNFIKYRGIYNVIILSIIACIILIGIWNIFIKVYY